jgi:hypothetical protein
MPDFPQPKRWNVRWNDPTTSFKASKIYRDGPRWGYTPDEAAIAADLPVPCNGGTSKKCYWKRVSELYLEYGMLDRLDLHGQLLERHLPGGVDQMVLTINPKGRLFVAQVLKQYP